MGEAVLQDCNTIHRLVGLPLIPNRTASYSTESCPNSMPERLWQAVVNQEPLFLAPLKETSTYTTGTTWNLTHDLRVPR